MASGPETKVHGSFVGESISIETYQREVEYDTRLKLTHGGRARHNTLGPQGPKGLHPKTSGFEEGIHPTASGSLDKIHTASGFQDESPSSLRVPGQKPTSGGRLQYYIVESGQESMAKFN
ncbi:hypothetical protein YC2023_081923 [Brassica napus]